MHTGRLCNFKHHLFTSEFKEKTKAGLASIYSKCVLLLYVNTCIEESQEDDLLVAGRLNYKFHTVSLIRRESLCYLTNSFNLSSVTNFSEFVINPLLSYDIV